MGGIDVAGVVAQHLVRILLLGTLPVSAAAATVSSARLCLVLKMLTLGLGVLWTPQQLKSRGMKETPKGTSVSLSPFSLSLPRCPLPPA